MPTRCNRGFYCRSYCLLNMFRASLCPYSEAQEYYTVVAACDISCCGFSSSCSAVELRFMRPVCRMLVYCHILTTMYGQNHIKQVNFICRFVVCCLSCFKSLRLHRTPKYPLKILFYHGSQIYLNFVITDNSIIPRNSA